MSPRICRQEIPSAALGFLFWLVVWRITRYIRMGRGGGCKQQQCIAPLCPTSDRKLGGFLLAGAVRDTIRRALCCPWIVSALLLCTSWSKSKKCQKQAKYHDPVQPCECYGVLCTLWSAIYIAVISKPIFFLRTFLNLSWTPDLCPFVVNMYVQAEPSKRDQKPSIDQISRSIANYPIKVRFPATV